MIRPRSLVLRVTLALLGAVSLVFVVLLLFIVWRALGSDSGEIDRSLRTNAETILAGIDPVEDEAALRAVIRIFEQPDRSGDTDEPRVSTHIVAIRRDAGTVLSTRGTPAVDPAALVPGALRLDLDGRRYRGFLARGERWDVALLDREDDRRRDVVVQTLRELALNISIVLPLLVLPVWLAVRAGMQPLRRLSATIAARDPADVSTLPGSAGYSELDPLVRILNLQFARAAERIRREQSFVHDAAHELRTPLAAISAQAHVLAISEGDERTTALRRLEGAIARCSHLVQQLLSLARADASRSRPDAPARSEPFDLVAMLRETLIQFEPVASGAGCELSLDGPDEVEVRGDRELLRTAFANLVDNALKYGSAGGRVEVSLSRDADDWVLAVGDRGPGIDDADLQRAFERFWRAPGHRAPGTGLGLAIVREVMLGLGGDARLSAREGGGCEARLRWPVARTAFDAPGPN